MMVATRSQLMRWTLTFSKRDLMRNQKPNPISILSLTNHIRSKIAPVEMIVFLIGNCLPSNGSPLLKSDNAGKTLRNSQCSCGKITVGNADAYSAANVYGLGLSTRMARG